MLASTFPVWKTVRLGVLDGENLRGALDDAGIVLSWQARDALGKIVVASKEIEVKLVRLTLAELGFSPRGAGCLEVCTHAKEEFGLRFCPPEVIPQLRLQYTDQSQVERLIVPVEPVSDLGGGMFMFSAERGGGWQLLAIDWWGNANVSSNSDYKFVFVPGE